MNDREHIESMSHTLDQLNILLVSLIYYYGNEIVNQAFNDVRAGQLASN